MRIACILGFVDLSSELFILPSILIFFEKTNKNES